MSLFMINHLAVAQQIKNKLLASAEILLVTHQHPDGDGLGALSALAQYLSLKNKKYQLFCLHRVPENSSFLPLMHQIASAAEVFDNDFEAIVVLDSGDLGYAGIEHLLDRQKVKTLINIDHHPTNTSFGDINLVLPHFSSASEIVYQLFRYWQQPINKEMATALLNGIIFDTGAFSNAATSLSSLKVASHLLNLGARHNEINEKVLRNKGLGLLKLWGRAFERLQYNSRYNLAFTVVLSEDLQELGVDLEAASGLANFFNELYGAKASLILIQLPTGGIKGSFRTTSDDVDVARLAGLFGGGGHQKAAGFSVKGKLVYNESKWEII